MAAIDLLGMARSLGLRVKIDDEGGYWPGRRSGELRRRLDRMNGAVAALAGALMDANDEPSGAAVESPIFGHPEFERIEAGGAARDGASVAAAVKLLRSRSARRQGETGG